MSAGPIKQWRDAYRPARVSTTDTARMCGLRAMDSTECGRKARRGHVTTNWDDVTCGDCHAARRADEVRS